MYEGLDYNTQREKMSMTEYGRAIHLMVKHCIDIENKEERQQCAESIVAIMEKMRPAIKQQDNYKQKLWNHLAIISNFKLDIDYPYEITTKEKFLQKPAPLKYPKRNIPVKHYGELVFKLLEYLKEMQPGEERDELTKYVANQMKRDLVTYGTSAPNNERIISDIAQFTDGIIQIDPNEFTFEYIDLSKKEDNKGKKKKKK